MDIKAFIAFLREQFPQTAFFNSTIDRSKKCVGIYGRSIDRIQPIGGATNGSYGILPVSILVHWTEDAVQCEDMARGIYDVLSAVSKEQLPDGTIISFVRLLDNASVWVGRDDKNIAERTIRANIIYERGV